VFEVFMVVSGMEKRLGKKEEEALPGVQWFERRLGPPLKSNEASG